MADDEINSMSMALRRLSFSKDRLTSLLGISIDGNSLQVAWVRRTNGSCTVERTFSTELSLNPLTQDPQLVGREIRNYLNSKGLRERRCVICLPLDWAFTLQAPLPDLPPSDLEDFLQLEAERGFPASVESLSISHSRGKSTQGTGYAFLVAVPRNHITLLEQSLRAAQLKPIGISLGLPALVSPDAPDSQGLLTIAIREKKLELQVTTGGGVAALRTLDEAMVEEGAGRRIDAALVAREVRITLGQLPEELRGAVNKARVIGPSDQARELIMSLRSPLERIGLSVEPLGADQSPDRNRVGISSAAKLAERRLLGRPPVFELKPPEVTAWQQFQARYAGRKLGLAGSVAAAVVLLVGGVFLVQQWQLTGLKNRWAKMSKEVKQLDEAHKQIRRFRPWYDEAKPTLAILKTVVEAFPENGSVYATEVEIAENNKVICTVKANNQEAIQKVLSQLADSPHVRDIKSGARTGESPDIRTSFEFTWANAAGGANAN
jgi:hypothetical protein